MTFTLYQVGGSVRDELLGKRSKDIDYAVVADFAVEQTAEETFDSMVKWLELDGFEIFVSSPEYFTVRARFPKGHKLARQEIVIHRDIDGDPTGFSNKTITADFVLCRKEGAYSDGRRPDEVFVGTLKDDLRRRDFTVNALAKDENGVIIDLHGGVNDIRAGIIRCVGNSEDRIREDALRALRAIRFHVILGFEIHWRLQSVLGESWLPPLIAAVSVERRREELVKAFHHDTERTLAILMGSPPDFREAVFADGLWLKPTLEA